MTAVYWDSSAVLSAIVRDEFTGEARARIGSAGSFHLLSSLALAEVESVLARMTRDGSLDRGKARRARAMLDGGPWRLTLSHPSPGDLKRLAAGHHLKGADLWHLANAMKLSSDLGDLVLLTFDDRLKASAAAEGMST